MARRQNPVSNRRRCESDEEYDDGRESARALYEPLAQIVNDKPRIQFVVRSVVPPAGELKAVQQTLRRTEPASGIEVETMFRAIGFAFLPSQVGAFLHSRYSGL